jgi:hypothetical protein
MSHNTRVRILVSLIGGGIVALIGVPAVRSGAAPAWAFGLALGWAAVIGLASPEIERTWARSRFWGSDHYWRNR